jgi:ATP-binding cassette subfamily F protein 3
MQAYEQINAMKNELEDVNHQLATRTDYESDAYSDLIVRMTELNDLLMNHDAYNLEGDVEKYCLV